MKIEKIVPPSFLLLERPASTSNGSDSCFFLEQQWFALYFEEWANKNYLGQATLSVDGADYFALLSKGEQRSRLGLRYQSIGFNEATEPLVQNLTIEFNDFLSSHDQRTTIASSAGTSLPVFEKCFDALLTGLLKIANWDELRISAVSSLQADAAVQIAQHYGLVTTVFSERFTYSVDLNLIREKFNSDYIASRSSNTRAQLRKSKRSIENALGPIRLEPANSLECAHDWLTELGTLHAKQWNESKAIEGFNNPRFVAFHRKALDRMWHESTVQILRLSAGDKPLVYLHYFVVDKRAYFNMSGINYEALQAVQPGLIAHWLAIDFFGKQGAAVYDFMAGTYRYKESLCTTSSEQRHLLFRRRRWFFVLEDFFRRLKRSRS